MNEATNQPGVGENEGRKVSLKKIYLRDASVEVPDGPRVFTQEWQPDVNVDLNTRVQDLGEDGHHVLVTVTVTAKQDDKTAYIIEVQQAGVFQVTGFDDEAERRHVIGAYCPNLLFPYVRETVGDFIQRAGFPHLLLQPVNFDALYQRHMEEQEGEQREIKH